MTELEGNDFLASVIAMHVRNALEALHCELDDLTDEVMREVNQRTRRAIWEVLEAFEGRGDLGDDRALGWLISSVPSYWEAPSMLDAESGLERATSPAEAADSATGSVSE